MEIAKKIKPLITRKNNQIDRNYSKVILRAHIPDDMGRIVKIINRVINLPESKAAELLKHLRDNYYDRHKDIEQQFNKHYEKVSEYLPINTLINDTKKKLIGAHFTMEYSIESAALFNPSIVIHPNQVGVKKGELRFILSLRATGEGHISCIVFRSGTIKQNGSVHFDDDSKFVETPSVLNDPTYDSHLFIQKLADMKSWDKTSNRIFEKLPDQFTYRELKSSITALFQDPDFVHDEQTINRQPLLI